MRITELNKPLTAKTLNENVAQKFGQKLDLENFTLEQLEDARNKIRTKLSQFETSSNYNAVYEDESYAKNKLFLDVLNRAIEERSQIVEFSDMERMVLEKVEQGLIAFEDLPEELQSKVSFSQSKEKAAVQVESILHEGEEEKAELIMAARDMVDRITGWMEDTANMQAESMLELVDSIRDELGSDVAEQFSSTVKPALEDLYNSLESHRTTMAQAVSILTGEEGPGGAPGGGAMDGMDMGGAEMPATMGAPDMGVDDEFGGAEAATGGEEPAGRMRRESIEYSRKLGTILSSKKK